MSLKVTFICDECKEEIGEPIRCYFHTDNANKFIINFPYDSSPSGNTEKHFCGESCLFKKFHSILENLERERILL